VTIRVPLIAGFNLDRDELRKLADAAAKLPRRTPVELLPGHALGACRGGADPTPSPEQITLAADTFARKGLETTVRW
jgi:hypothetical protein